MSTLLLFYVWGIYIECPFYGDIDGFYKRVLAEIKRKTCTLAKIEDENYGSGYASFVDAWFFKDNEDFALEAVSKNNISYTGLVVLLHKFLPVYCMFEKDKSWNITRNSSCSYMPHASLVDSFNNKKVIELSRNIENILKTHGLKRLNKDILQTDLGSTKVWSIPTVLSDEHHYTYFDGLFYWED